MTLCAKIFLKNDPDSEIDEMRGEARNREWRISEKTLIGIAVIGGCVGAILGMHVFHHKTRHWYFRYGLPLILILQGVLTWFVYKVD